MCWGLIPSSAIKSTTMYELPCEYPNKTKALTLEQWRFIVKVGVGSASPIGRLAYRVQGNRGRSEDLSRVHVRGVVSVVLIVVGGRWNSSVLLLLLLGLGIVIGAGVVERLKVPAMNVN